AAREAAAEAEAAAKLEAAKQAAEAEARERREAALRASEAAARERLRTSGSIPRVVDQDSSNWRPPKDSDPEPAAPKADEPEDSAGEASELGSLELGGLKSGGSESDAPAADPAAPAPPKRQSIAKSGVSLWGRPKRQASDGGGSDAGQAPLSWADQLDTAEALEASKGPEAGVRTESADSPNQLGGSAGKAADSAPAQDKRTDGEAEDAEVADDGDGQDGIGGRARVADADRVVPAAATDQDELDSGELTQAFLPDFLKDESEAPANIAEAAANAETEALERPGLGHPTG
ncbi:MAG: hypothetical protein LBC97_16680, partial [Bifidobacteriaceae bacterium]|nr:hypothetical protein [Bifidobacteriaceae bacterium]